MHARQQIRDKLIAILTGLTTTGANVFGSRIYNHDSLPSIAIYTQNEELGEESGTRQLRLLNVVVEVRVTAVSGFDDTLDTISAEIETAIFASDTTLQGLCKDFDFEGLEIEYSGDGEQPIALMNMRFVALYRVDKTDVTTLIN